MEESANGRRETNVVVDVTLGWVEKDNAAYWLEGFENGGHFTNLTQVIMEELSRNLDDMSPETFSLDVSEEVLDKHNWKALFNYTEQIVKAMKLIALQDDLLKSNWD